MTFTDTEPTRWIELEHCTLPYWRIGQGPDLVFVHGWPLHAGTWRHCVDALSSHFTCHLFDLPGAGQSRWERTIKADIRSMGDITHQAIEAMDLGERPVVLIGQDSGGTFARLAAAQLGDRLAGMVLGNTEIPGHHPWRLNVMLPLANSPTSGKLLMRALNSRLGRLALMAEAIADRSLIERELNALFLEPLARKPRALAGAMLMPQHLRSASDFDIVAEAHPRIQAPVRLIWGSRDVWFPLAKARPMSETFGGPVELSIVEGARLLVHEDAPARFADETGAHAEACFTSAISAP